MEGGSEDEDRGEGGSNSRNLLFLRLNAELTMQAERLILETDRLGNLKQVPKLPPNKQIEVIFLIIADTTEVPRQRRTPHPDIVGKVQLSTNIIDSVPEADWEQL
jgi:hypothetical protein